MGRTLVQPDTHVGKRKVISLQAAAPSLPGAGLGDHFLKKLGLPQLSPPGFSARSSMGHRPPSGKSLDFPHVERPVNTCALHTWTELALGNRKVSVWGTGCGHGVSQTQRRREHQGGRRVAAGAAWALCPRGELTHHRFTRKTCSISCMISSSRNTLRTSSRSMHCCLFMYFMAYIFSVSRFCTMHTCGAEGASGGRHHPASHAGHGRCDSGMTRCLRWGKFLCKVPSQAGRTQPRARCWSQEQHPPLPPAGTRGPSQGSEQKLAWKAAGDRSGETPQSEPRTWEGLRHESWCPHQPWATPLPSTTGTLLRRQGACTALKC